MAERTLQEIFEEQAEQEAWLERKYPWAEILRNWTVALLLSVLVVATIVYGIQDEIDRKSTEKTATAMAEVEAKKLAEENAEAEAFEAWLDENSDYIAQMFFGARNYEEKYQYTEEDFETYSWSAFNRADARGVELKEVIFEEHNGVTQYVAASPHNTIQQRYKDMGKKFLLAWKNSERPCDIGYQYAELVPQGIFLWSDTNTKRWRA